MISAAKKPFLRDLFIAADEKRIADNHRNPSMSVVVIVSSVRQCSLQRFYHHAKV